MVADPDTIWLGLEYFCNEGDALWKLSDSELLELAKDELHKISIIDKAHVLDGTVVRVPKTYPAYFGAYERFDEIRNFTDHFENLFLIGRNGMHKYNNQDHSMLTAITAVQNIKNGILSKDNIWNINTEMEYHEEK
jgi:protoporphyrinogen oxidase